MLGATGWLSPRYYDLFSLKPFFPLKTPLSEVFVVRAGAGVKSPLGWFLGEGGKREKGAPLLLVL